MGSKAKAPPTPNYTELAQQQGTLNKETALQQWLLNNSPNSTPYGTREIIADPNSPSGYRIQETLNPQDQQRLEQQRQIMSGVMGLAPGALNYLGGVIGKPLDVSTLPSMVSGVGTDGLQYGFDRGNMVYGLDMSGGPQVGSGEQVRKDVTDAIMGQYNTFAAPQAERARKALETQIANQGGVSTSNAARMKMADLLKAQADERTGAGFQGILSGVTAGNQQFQQDLARRQQAVQELMASGQFANEAQAQDYMQRQGMADFRNQGVQQNIQNQFANANLANSARTQGLQELLNLRQAPLNELMALLGGTQVAPMQFQNATPTSWQPANVYGAAKDQYGAQLANANAAKAQQSGLLSGLFSLGGAALGGPMGGMIGNKIGSMF